MAKGKNEDIVMGYVEGIANGTIVANRERIAGAKLFLAMLENKEYEFKVKDAEFVISIIESNFRHRQGQSLEGFPMRGKPFLLEPWQKFCIYGMLSFYKKGTKERIIKEAFVFIARKNSKTFFIAALAWGLGILERKSGAVVYVFAATLKQAMETFDSWKYNLCNSYYNGEKAAKKAGWRIVDNNMEHSISHDNVDGEGGSVKFQALAGDPENYDSLNCNIAIADEVHTYRNSKPYDRMKEATAAYTNKLFIGITTAGDFPQGFCAKHLDYCKGVLSGKFDNKTLFSFICKADEDENGDVDYLNPAEHEKANPNYGITIRPEDMRQGALDAQNDPQKRTSFLNRKLNIFTASLKSYFNLIEFQLSNEAAGKILGIDPKWSWKKKIEALVKLPIKWYGGADLSKMHDLTTASLHGEYKGIDISITHEWFPIVMAQKKADEDNIPLFGWQDDGHLTMCNAPTVNHMDLVNWFVSMRKMGFKIKEVGHDRKFCREYFVAMKIEGFKVVDQPQYFYKKSEGFRRIEQKAKNKQLYYLGSEAYEYCVSNVHAIEKTDDMVQYEKIKPEMRIDVFDADVFATIRMLENLENKEKEKTAKRWLNEK